MVLCNISTIQAAEVLLPEEMRAFPFPTAELLMPCPGGPGTIGGYAFQDFNYNGLDDQTGRRIGDIEVSLFTCGLSGESELVATTVTDENGDYFFSNLIDGQEYRVEFNTPETLFYMQSGFSATQSRTTVQFVTSPNCETSIGLANPDDYCEEDPKLIVPCFINGDPVAIDGGGEDALVCFNTSFEGINPTPTYLASAREIGSTWGLTYNKLKKEVYTSAFLKRHVGLGSLGLGGIYKVEVDGTSSEVSPFFDLNDLGANIGTYSSNMERGLAADTNLPSNDPEAYDDVGKKGMGGLTISVDGNTLYVIGLSDKMLHIIDISSGTPTAANLQSVAIPDPGCSGGEFRPFGIQIYNEEIYVGGICDAEASGLKSDLKAVIYRMDGTTFTEVLNFSLDFQKGLASRSCDDDRGWFPWSSEIPEGCFVSGTANIVVQPTPILSDIEFDENGDMIIGFMDRIGNQLGYLNYGLTGETELYSAFTGGDIMKATTNGDGSFTIENNGTAGPNTTVGADNGEGIGGGEFFSFDVFEIAPNIPRPHSETAQGGVALIKGTNQVIGTSLDPFGTFVNSGGVNYWNLTTGDVRDPGYVIFRSGSNSISTFSKANGLGDIATLCSLAPIELGGRVWVDANTNGVQDPCEMILSDITVTLYTTDGIEVGTTVTNAVGDYFFSDSVIRPNSEYIAVFGSDAQTQTPLALLDIYTPTARNVGMSPNNSLNDSDVQAGNILGITNALYIPITTGGPGAVSHSNDAGFFEIPPPVGANITGQVFNDINQNGLQDSGEPFISGVIITLFNTDGTVVATTETDDNGNYIFQNVLEGDFYVGINLQTDVDGAVLNVEPTALDAGDDTLDSDFDPSTGQTAPFSFDPSEGDRDFDAGVFRPSGMINGIAFDDFNGNGIQDANEPGIGGITVTLLDCNGVVIATLTTDQGGNYSFGDLDMGDYQVRFDPSGNSSGIDNYIASPKGEGTDDTQDSDIDASFTSDCVSVFLDAIEIDGGFTVPKATITGTAFEDINADGIRADTDLPIAGITVILSDCTGNEITRTTTDDSGNYVFDNLELGAYQVRFDQVGNDNGIDFYEVSPQNAGGDDTRDSDVDAQFTSDCIELMEKPIIIDAGFNEPTATVIGSVFEDSDGDGIQDPDEGLIINLIVSLVDCDGTVVATTITDEFGNYSFGDIMAGDYRIVFGTPLDTNGNEFMATEQDAGDDDTIDSDIGADNSTECTSFAPNSDNDISAGFIPPSGDISGIAFFDENKDGVQDANELGIPGITVALQDCNGATIATTTTDNDGNYSFSGILSDNYTIVFNPSTNTNGITDFTASPRGAGSDSSLDSDIDIITNASDCISFDPSQGLEIDAGFFRPTGILQVAVFDDLNGNGIHDVGEPVIEGVTVILQDCDGNELATTVTDFNGSYSFGDILAGNYQIEFDPSTNGRGIVNYHASPQGFDSDIDPETNTTVCFFFDPITGFMTEAGFFQPTGTLLGVVFNDLNQDGVLDANEPFFGGITVALQDCNGLTVATTISNPDGSYSFDDVLLGNYQVVFNPTTNTDGINGLVASPRGNDSDIDPATNSSDCVAFDPEKGLDVDAGFYEPVGSITGTSFEDVDGDGLQDPEEGLIIGLTVSLVDCDGTVVATVLTDEFGNYDFGMVAAGNYEIVFGSPTDINGNEFMATTPNAGNDDTIDSDIDPTTNSTGCISYDPVENTDINAGFIPPTGDLIGTVFLDDNKNGVQDPGETGIEGITVRLQDCNGVTIETTTTDQNGNYTFTGLLSDSYQIVFDETTNTSSIPVLTTSPKDAGGNDALDSDINSSNNATDCLPFNSNDGLDIDAGFFQPTGTLVGIVFNDLNQDGILDANEPFFGGITVALQDCNGLTIATTISNPDGSYSFGDVLLGNYQVVFNPTTNTDGINGLVTSPRGNDSDIDPATNSSDCVAFDPDKGLDIDAGFFQPTGTLVGIVFNDINQDGVLDANEPFFGGITVALQDCNGTIISTTTSNPDGSYSFNDVLVGNYQVVFNPITNTGGINGLVTSPRGNDSDIDPTTNASDCLAFEPAKGENVDAGFYEPVGSITGTSFEDLDGDGVQDPDEGLIIGLTVSLVDCDGTVVATTLTDEFGNYDFGMVAAGDYEIIFGSPTDINGNEFMATAQNAGNDDTIDSDIDPTTNSTGCISYDPIVNTDINAGFIPPTGDLMGTVFLDENKNGIQDDGEEGIGGVTVRLQDCNGVTIETTTTDQNGDYAFTGLLSDSYQIVFDESTNTGGIPDFTTSPQNVGGNDALDSDINSNNTTDCLPFNSNEGLDVDAGFFRPSGNLFGIVFNDLNGDGIQDANEPGIGGVTVELRDCNGTVVATTTSNPDGSYSFDDILLGNYQVFFNPDTNNQGIPDFETSPEGGDSDIDPLNNTSDCIAFDPATGLDVNAGFVQPTGIIMGTAFNDLDGDGMQEPGELAIAGVTVRLLDCNGTVLATTTTDGNGNYFFENQTIGSYRVVFDVNTNTDNILDYQTSPQNMGDDEMDSDIDPITNTSDCFEFNPMNGADIDAGFIQPKGQLMGTIFNDIDADGMQEAGEVGIRGVTVVLLDGEGMTVGTTTTDANGNYFFPDLISGAYQILIDPATNSAGIDDFMSSPANQGDDEMDSDINPSTNRSDIFTFIAADGGDIDGGLFQPAEPVIIGNMVFKDCNKNGILDPGETGQSGVIVMLSGTTLLGDAVNQQTESNQDGNYQFNIGRPGTYQVMFVIPDDLTGVEFSAQNIGNNDMIDSDANPSTGIVSAFEIGSGEIVNDVDVGIIDLAAPLLFNVPPDITVSCNNPPDLPTSVKAVDNCDPDVDVAFDERIEANICGSSIVRTWTAEDRCGNITRRQQTITITDEEAPVITLSNPLLAGIPNGGSIIFDCDAFPEFDENDIIATDNCDTDLTIEFVDLIRREGNCQVDGYLTEMTCGWRAIDNCGNEMEYIITITVVDTRAPMLNNVPADATVNLSAGEAIPPVPTNVGATDNCDENIFIQFEQTQTEDTACGYDLIRTWTAIDNCGNKETVSQTLSLIRDCVCPDQLSDGQMVLHAACDGSMGGMILFNLTADAQYYEFDFVPNLGVPNALGNARTDLPLGTYNIVVTYKGAADCTETYNINIGTTETATVSIADSRKASCGQADGFISLAPASFQYVWSDGIAGAQRSDLPAGTYKVTYTDDNGCLGSTEITVEEPENCICLNFAIEVLQNTSPSCSGGTDGNLIAVARGGRETIRYEWSNGSTGTTLSNITAGIYTVTATDANGCQAQEDIKVWAPESIMLTINQTNGACGERGSIDLHAQGGTAPYRYAWNTGATSQDLFGIESGPYTVTVTDANNCTSTTNALISNGGTIDIQLGKQLPTCSDNSNGIVFATVTGGSAPYTYQWSNGSTAKDLTNIGRGDYSLVVTDINGCQSAAQISVEAPPAINILLTPQTFCSESIANISSTVTGGTAPYTYLWNFGATTAMVENLVAGTYSVTVTDRAGCEEVEVITLDVPAAFAINPTVVSPSCANAVGSIVLNASGGILPYTYAWSNGSTTSSLEGIPTGTYSATVVDQRGCSLISTHTFNDIAPLDGSSSTINPSCADGTDGQIIVNVTGGTQPYSYQWQTGATTQNLTGIGAGLYNLTVTDANGCQRVFTEGLLGASPITISAQNRTDALCESADGTLSIVAAGGTAPYTYRWNTGATSASLTNLVAGNYEVTVTDARGCTARQLFVVSSDCTCPSPLYTAIMVNNARCGNSNGNIMIMVDQLERYTFDWGAVGTVGAANNERRNLPAGQYNVRVTYAGQAACSEIISVTVGNSAAEEATIVSNIPAGCDQNNGQIELAPATFVYQWADGVVGPRRTNLAPGIYNVQILDDNGCSSSQQISVTQMACNTPTTPTVPTTPTTPTVPTTPTTTDCEVLVSLLIVNAKCAGEASGTARVNVIDGKAPYTYSWSNGERTSEVSALLAGVYRVTVTDANGCTGIEEIRVTEPSALNFTHEIVGGNCDRVEVAFSGTGGTSVWKWVCEGQEGAINETILLAPGTYTCFIMDTQWCSSLTQEITIGAIPQDSCGGSVVSEEGQFQFTQFEGKEKAETFAALDWSTKDELYTGNFLIEHSTDGTQFNALGIAIPATGPTLVGTYNQLTTLPNFGSNYFRIKYIDVMGNTSISDVIELFKKLPRTSDRAIVYPNPIAEQYTIDFLRPIEEEKQMIVTNNLGTVVDEIVIPIGTIKYSLDATTYKAGIYTLMVSNRGEKNTTIRFVKLEL